MILDWLQGIMGSCWGVAGMLVVWVFQVLKGCCYEAFRLFEVGSLYCVCSFVCFEH